MKTLLKIILWVVAIILVLIILLSTISKPPNESISNEKNSQTDIPSRESKIPASAIKQTPETDENQPKSLSDEYEAPVPLSSVINTAGAEDSPFITADGNTLYFFFTPDVNVSAEKQLLDGVTGIYSSKKSGNSWTQPERIFLTERDKLALDGCEFVFGNTMWFCSARESYSGINWFSAEFENGKWVFSKTKIEFPEEYQVGELHKFGDELYFHSSRTGGKGGLDIWKTKRNSDDKWSTPENLGTINSADGEGWPAVSPDGNELWFSKDYGIWRNKKINGEWQKPEQILTNLAGEPSIDPQGNVYFVHHFYKNNKMIESDIYMARKR